MTILAVFKSHVPNIGYIFKNGKTAPFINGKYITELQTEIDELKAEIGNYINPVINDKNQVVSHDGIDVSNNLGAGKSNHPHIYIDPDEKEIDTNAPTALDLIKQEAYAQARKDLEEEQARSLNAAGNTSTSDAGKTAASFNNTASAGSITGVTATPAPDATSKVTMVNPALAAKLAAMQNTTTPVATSATVQA